ncbi:hypothetical protein Phum_PHUM008210 [Pediculus humanus corporis]|uniref:Uncharacterized protein n=1 Tax=Pediculus humanus subsp. corporis TaxID=121224 RepID=E0V9C4_PEDHC|nr:uncharacterized protein Phum_PHUM008210 [Pediculus humanus corporis]EEB09980.1 hypothetical protein Phum_PHUM008210 [Pediculus humanus corporis]
MNHCRKIKVKIYKDGTDSGIDNTSDTSDSNDDNPLGKRYRKVQIADEKESSSTTSTTQQQHQQEHKRKKKNCDIMEYLKFNENLYDCDNKTGKQFFNSLILGQYETVDFTINSNTAGKPSWLNVEKFRRGQKFARDHFFCINFAEMLSLFILFAQKSALDALIYTGNSDSPYTAFVRYLSTVVKLLSWYQDDDVWNDEVESFGKNNLTIVRGMHKNVYTSMTNSSNDELMTKTTLGDPSRVALWCPLQSLLLQDFPNAFRYKMTTDKFSPLK